MQQKKLSNNIFKLSIIIFLIINVFLLCNKSDIITTQASIPFYNLQPKACVLRSKFYTSYSTSSEERISNIKLAAQSLDKTFVDVGGEFSFNATVGARTEQNGYMPSKIIVGGKFVDGIGGGVCQVSTTLYNAVLLAGLNVTEFHPHSLPVSYISPSFDAMVSFGYADLKFINNTCNPIILHTITTNTTITIEIYGEPNEFTYTRQSVMLEEIPAPKEKEIIDEKGEYPDLLIGQRKIVKYSKTGIKSQGVLIKRKNGKIISTQKLRTDTYKPTQGIVILGQTPVVIENENINIDYS